eukprot:TRINITY_DN5394_c0_g1_i1.p1 TRINITY_DN5394_c0_g1~~TRINITY_DN5394_c0_g1_i1.p1  ORF type:complete len:438 (-),score=103.32 TRINITY_DN5394_c0_g1_i1:1300-2613(-)
MTDFVLYTLEDDPFQRLVLIVARYAQVHVRVEHVTDGSVEGNLFGKVPCLVVDGECISYVGAIIKTIARCSVGYPHLLGRSVVETGKVDSWIEWVRTDFELPAATLLYPLWRFIEGNDEDIINATEDLLGYLEVINGHVTENTFLIGSDFTLADIFVAYSFIPLYIEVFDIPIRKLFSSFTRWFETVIDQPEFKEVFGLVEPSKKNPYDMNLKEFRSKKATENQKTRIKTQKKETPPVQEKSTVFEEEPAVPPAEQSADIMAPVSTPIESEPEVSNSVGYLRSIESNFNLGEWKRKYANCVDVRSEVLDWFWDNFDDGHSLWISTYNYPEECKKGYYAANMISGFLQRTDAVKEITRYAQSSMCVYGQDDHFNIVGIWIFKGQVIPPEFTYHIDDTQYYTWTKVDLSDETQKSKASDLWCWEPETIWGTFTSGKTWG